MSSCNCQGAGLHRNGLRALVLGLAAWLAGCGDGMVAVTGWVIEAPHPPGGLVLLPGPPSSEAPPNAVADATVELWTEQDGRLLCRVTSQDGAIRACYVGPYRPEMRYWVRADAPGFAPLRKPVKLRRGAPTSVRIGLMALPKRYRPKPDGSP